MGMQSLVAYASVVFLLDFQKLSIHFHTVTIVVLESIPVKTPLLVAMQMRKKKYFFTFLFSWKAKLPTVCNLISFQDVLQELKGFISSDCNKAGIGLKCIMNYFLVFNLHFNSGCNQCSV